MDGSGWASLLVLGASVLPLPVTVIKLSRVVVVGVMLLGVEEVAGLEESVVVVGEVAGLEELGGVIGTVLDEEELAVPDELELLVSDGDDEPCTDGPSVVEEPPDLEDSAFSTVGYQP